MAKLREKSKKERKGQKTGAEVQLEDLPFKIGGEKIGVFQVALREFGTQKQSVAFNNYKYISSSIFRLFFDGVGCVWEGGSGIGLSNSKLGTSTWSLHQLMVISLIRDVVEIGVFFGHLLFMMIYVMLLTYNEHMYMCAISVTTHSEAREQVKVKPCV